VALNAQPDLREMATANRAFLHRTVSYLAKRGITQYLDIGPGYPDAGNTAEVSRTHQLRARVAFADYDPYVVAHTRALLESTDAAHTAVVHADLRTPTEILEHPHVKKLFDFDQPIYGRRIEVTFLSKLRDEAKYPDVETLSAQIRRDAEAGRAYLARIGALEEAA